jgi:phosphate uptake regulator
MKKNVVAQGPSTLMVSLPAKWVKYYGIKKRDQLDLVVDGRKLVFSTDSVDDEVKSKTIKLLDSYSHYVWTEVIANFVSGYDEIRIENISVEAMSFIESDMISAIMGFDIVKQTSSYVVLKKVMVEESSQFDTILRRVFLGLIEQSNILLNFFNTGEGIEYILNFEKTNNRQCNYLKRLLTKEGFEKRDKIVFISILIEYLLSIADNFKYLVWSIQKEDMESFDSKIISHCEDMTKKLNLVYKLYFNYSNDLYNEVETSTIRLESREGSVVDDIELNPHVMSNLCNIINDLRHITYQIHGINC